MFKEFSANRLQAGYGCILLEVWQKLKCKYLYTLIFKKWILTATCGKITHRQYEQNFKKTTTTTPDYSVLLFSLQNNS